MKLPGLFLPALLTFFSICTYGQTTPFQNGDRIIFIGSSIAMNGGNFHYLHLFYATRYPEKDIRFLNGGIGGDLSDDIIFRMEKDILAKKPTWAVIMLEENDLHRGLYFEERQNEPDITKKKYEAVQNWFRNADSLIRILRKNQIKVILQTPTIYDQTGDFPEKISYGLNDTLQQCARYLFQLSEKYKMPVVDCWTILNNINQYLQKKSLKNSIIGEDRRHVGPYGNFAMAYEFLKTMPIDPVVSGTIIDTRNNTIAEQTNCKVEQLKIASDKITFSRKSNSLPFPAPDEIYVDSLFPFSNEMNTDLLQIKGLKEGYYQLSIDQNIIHTFTNKALEKGINLSQFNHTPQYLQSMDALALFEKLWAIEYDLRMIDYMKYRYIRHFEHKETLEDIKNTFNEMLSKTRDEKTYRKLNDLFSTYLENTSKKEDMISTSVELLKSIRHQCIPIPHNYSIERLPD